MSGKDLIHITAAITRLAAKVWCKHYRGMQGKETCEAGVRFKELTGYGAKGFFDSCPCFSTNGTKCDKSEYPTAKEMAEYDAEINARNCRTLTYSFEADTPDPTLLERIAKWRLANTRKARIAIVEHLGGPWKRGTPGSSGKIDCPVCGGKESLGFSRAGYNGHIHASCQSDGCVRWMD